VSAYAPNGFFGVAFPLSGFGGISGCMYTPAFAGWTSPHAWHLSPSGIIENGPCDPHFTQIFSDMSASYNPTYLGLDLSSLYIHIQFSGHSKHY
jgi:hypothetical protein